LYLLVKAPGQKDLVIAHKFWCCAPLPPLRGFRVDLAGFRGLASLRPRLLSNAPAGLKGGQVSPEGTPESSRVVTEALAPKEPPVRALSILQSPR